jgi:hypothetical protein
MAGQVINGGRYVQFVTFTNGTTPSIGATVVASFADQISTDIAIDNTGVWTMTIDQIQDDEAYNTFIETYKDYAIAGVESITYENGAKQNANSNKTLYAIVKGGNVAGGSSAGKNKVAAFACILDLSSGAWKQEGAKYSRPRLVFQSVEVQGTITIPPALLSAVASTTAATQTQTTSQKYGRVYFL